MILGFVWDSQVLDIAKKVKSIVDLSGSIRRLLWHGSELVLVLADWSHDACGRHISWQTTHANAKLSGGTGGPWKTCGGMRAAACARGYAVLASGKSMYLVAFEPRYYPMKFRCVCVWQVCSVSVFVYTVFVLCLNCYYGKKRTSPSQKNNAHYRQTRGLTAENTSSQRSNSNANFTVFFSFSLVQN